MRKSCWNLFKYHQVFRLSKNSGIKGI